MDENDISYKIRGAIFKVYNELGLGLLESVYEAALNHELIKNGLFVDRQLDVAVIYDNTTLDIGFRLDLLVNNKVIIEIKSVKELEPVFHKQLFTYLKLSDKRLGILVNFNTDNISTSIIRIVNNL